MYVIHKIEVQSVNPIISGVLGPGYTPGRVESARNQFKGSQLFFDLETLGMLSEK